MQRASHLSWLIVKKEGEKKSSRSQWIYLFVVNIWQDHPSGSWDSRRANSGDVSPQPQCLKGRSQPTHQPEACEDHEWHCTICERSREIILYNSYRIPIGFSHWPMNPMVYEVSHTTDICWLTYQVIGVPANGVPK